MCCVVQASIISFSIVFFEFQNTHARKLTPNLSAMECLTSCATKFTTHNVHASTSLCRDALCVYVLFMYDTHTQAPRRYADKAVWCAHAQFDNYDVVKLFVWGVWDVQFDTQLVMMLPNCSSEGCQTHNLTYNQSWCVPNCLSEGSETNNFLTRTSGCVTNCSADGCGTNNL